MRRHIGRVLQKIDIGRATGAELKIVFSVTPTKKRG